MRLYNLEVLFSQAVFSLIWLPVIYAIIYWLGKVMSDEHPNRFHVLLMSLFIIYLAQVINLVFFPMMYNPDFSGSRRAVLADVNMTFWYFGEFSTFNSSLETLLMNILLTVPFGLMLPFIVKINSKMVFFIAPAIGLLLEGTQLLLNLWLRYSYRVVDIHDVITNAIGVWVGYCLFLLCAIVYIILRDNLFQRLNNHLTIYLDWVMYPDEPSS